MATEERARPRKKHPRLAGVFFDGGRKIASRSYRLALSAKQKDIPCVTGSEQITGCPLVVTQVRRNWKPIFTQLLEFSVIAEPI